MVNLINEENTYNDFCAKDRWVTVCGNRMAKVYTDSIIKDLTLEEPKLVMLVGEAGCGKTTLLKNAYLKVKEKHPDVKITMDGVNQLISTYINAIKQSSVELFFSKYDSDVLFLDGLEYLDNKIKGSEMVVELVEKVLQHNGVIILSSQSLTKELNIAQSLRDLLCRSSIIVMHNPSVSERSLIIQQSLKKENIVIPPYLLNYILDTTKLPVSSFSEIHGFISSILTYYKIEQGWMY